MIAIIAGTNRGGSRTLLIARLLAGIYQELGAEPRLLDLRDLPPELFTPAAYEEDVPAFVERFVTPILAADGVHIVVPEYNGGYPGVLKYMLDMLPYPEAFEDRCTAFTGISNGRNGALRGVEQLQLVYGHRNAYIYPRRVFIPSVKGVLDADGAMTDPALVDRLTKQAKGFVGFCRCVRG